MADLKAWSHGVRKANWIKSMDNGEIEGIISVDIRKAFDSIEYKVWCSVPQAKMVPVLFNSSNLSSSPHSQFVLISI